MNPLCALQFLTTVRLWRTPCSLTQVAESQGFFAPVGLLLALLLVGFDRALSKALPIEAVAVVLIVALVLITGGLHLEGLADACDGLFGGHTRDERLAIMRDPRVGVYGVLGLVAVLGLKWAGLQSLPSTVRVEALLLVPTLSRWSMVVAIAAFPYARTEGLGRDFHAKAWPWGVALSGATVLAVAGALLGFGGLVVVGAATGVALALGAYGVGKLGGLTGDTYGGVLETVEALTLLAVGAAAQRGWLGALLLG